MFKILLILIVTLFCGQALAAVHSDTHTYILSPEEKKLLIIDKKTGQEKILKFNYKPNAFYIYKSKGYLFFTFGIQVIDLETHTFGDELLEKDQLGEMVIHEDIGYVKKVGPNNNYSLVVFIDLTNDQIINEIKVGDTPYKMNIHGDFGYVIHRNGGLTIIDLKNQKVLKVLDTPKASEDMIIKGEIGYVVCGSEGCIALINLKDQGVQGLIPVGHLPRTMVVQGDFGYIPCYHYGKFAVIDLKTNALRASVSLSEDHLFVKLYNNRAIVCGGVCSRKIHVVNLTSLTVEKEIGIEHCVDDIVLCGDKGFLNDKWIRKNITVIDLNTFEIIGQIPNPHALNIDNDGEKIYLGVTALSLPYNSAFKLFETPYEGIRGSLVGDGESAFAYFMRSYKLNKCSEATEHFEEALSLCHPKAFAIAAYAFLYGKWGAQEDFHWVTQFFSGMDKAYYDQLCAMGGSLKQL